MLSALSSFLDTWKPFVSILSSPGSNKYPQTCVLKQNLQNMFLLSVPVIAIR